MREEYPLRGEGEYFSPFSLDGGDILKVRQFNGSFVFQRHVRSEEVVVGDKEGNESDCAIDAIEPMSGFHVVFKSSVESFDELIEWPELL